MNVFTVKEMSAWRKLVLTLNYTGFNWSCRFS